MPWLEDAINQFEYLVVWKKAAGGDEDIPEPRAGLDEAFDGCNRRVDNIKARLTEHLEYVRHQLSKIHTN